MWLPQECACTIHLFSGPVQRPKSSLVRLCANTASSRQPSLMALAALSRVVLPWPPSHTCVYLTLWLCEATQPSLPASPLPQAHAALPSAPAEPSQRPALLSAPPTAVPRSPHPLGCAALTFKVPVLCPERPVPRQSCPWPAPHTHLPWPACCPGPLWVSVLLPIPWLFLPWAWPFPL